MLVCAFLCALCTRDRGCSAHPAFAAPSVFEGREFSAKLARNARRDREGVFVPFEKLRWRLYRPWPIYVVPALSRDPYAAGLSMRVLALDTFSKCLSEEFLNHMNHL